MQEEVVRDGHRLLRTASVPTSHRVSLSNLCHVFFLFLGTINCCMRFVYVCVAWVRAERLTIVRVRQPERARKLTHACVCVPT